MLWRVQLWEKELFKVLLEGIPIELPGEDKPIRYKMDNDKVAKLRKEKISFFFFFFSLTFIYFHFLTYLFSLSSPVKIDGLKTEETILKEIKIIKNKLVEDEKDRLRKQRDRDTAKGLFLDLF